ncbi:XRE family transcriptional regulator [Psychrobacillus glaciei]|uniref:XRE family transcriptional regulator n=1 Tax=Psychrobacillus glaciei TaxID=2283160 RepID=A0A5J6SLN1_9BACI|nr:helix-turn-helix transcriptional regulator [Psychrobacillus glaciei]QFF98778.1 XRE family transcriptional regulator [Psychrobacillus glaciei]
MKNNVPENIGDYIRRIRNEKGISINELVKQSGVSKGYISQIENGHFKPSADVLGKLSKSLRADFFELMVKAGYMTKESKENGLDENFITTMIKQLSFNDKKEFILDFICNSDRKYISRSNDLVKLRKESIEEISKIGDIKTLEEDTITDFLIENFYTFGSIGDYLKLLRLHRGISIDEMAHDLDVDKDEYLKNENSLIQGYPLLTEKSEQIGFLLNVGELVSWYSKQQVSKMQREGLVKTVKSFSNGILMKEDRKEKKWTFCIDYLMDNETKISLDHSNDDSQIWEKVSNNFFSIENLLFINKNISINNRLLTEKEKQKALQILQLVFNDSENNS